MVNLGLEQEITVLHNRVCYGVADPKRVLILYALDKGPLCVNELVEALGMPQSAVSRHLRILRERSLVSTERRGTAIYYALADRRLLEAMDLLRAVLAKQLADTADLARSIGQESSRESPET